jgi:hypothetical protein
MLSPTSAKYHSEPKKKVHFEKVAKLGKKVSTKKKMSNQNSNAQESTEKNGEKESS